MASSKNYRTTNVPSSNQVVETKRGGRLNKEFSLYIKGIVSGMDKNVLNNVFTTFGAVKSLDVVPSKSCAFVEFFTKEAYEQALMQKMISVPDLGTVTIEERRPKDRNRKGKGRNISDVIST
ncbi:hypothetical protein C1645_762106 [Glomus cerebriforme]|uniref:RRM domain-containing protein n=1 Tax=Glomus cerebriforme TaxID=658196 RepID=A0A397TAZ6_9GLOM|nr:hypothetical protein C1645_762106 [Glomus cerebriforme]